MLLLVALYFLAGAVSGATISYRLGKEENRDGFGPEHIIVPLGSVLFWPIVLLTYVPFSVGQAVVRAKERRARQLQEREAEIKALEREHEKEIRKALTCRGE